MRLNRGVMLIGGLVVGLLTQTKTLWSVEKGGGASSGEKTFQTAQVGAIPTPELPLISLDFKDANIQMVLETLARKANVNIVAGKGVSESVTLRLDHVTWEQALDTIANTYGLGYERQGNIIVVMTADELKSRREAAKALMDAEPLVTKVIQLNFLDAADVAKFLEPQLSPQGKVSVLEITGQKGWAFGAGQSAGASAAASAGSQVGQRKARENARSKLVVVTDTASTVSRLEKILAEIDVLPKLILIKARVMEVDRNLLRDLGIEMGTGASSTNLDSSHGFVSSTGARTFTQNAAQDAPNNVQLTRSTYGGSSLNQFISPSTFVPTATGLSSANTGLSFVFRQLRGAQLEILLRALEEDARTNTLSSPHILTLSGQEAKILVGTKYPILKTDVSGTSTSTTTTSLDYYQDIGIELFVVPQVSGARHIDMIIHPIISTRNGTVGQNAYPILDIREAETQVILEQGDTIVIGGLLKDAKSKSRIGLPFLGKIPFLGPFFARSTVDDVKVDLLIFITAQIVEPGMFPAEDLGRLQEEYEKFLHDRLTVNQKEESRPSAAVSGPPSQERVISPPRTVEFPPPVIVPEAPVTSQPEEVSPAPPAPTSSLGERTGTESLEELTRIQSEYKQYLSQKRKKSKGTSPKGSPASQSGNRGILYQKS